MIRCWAKGFSDSVHISFILDLGSSGEKVHEADHRDFHGTFSGIRTKVVLSKVLVERGLTFEAAEDILLSSHGSDDGFYESRTVGSSL